MVGLANKNVSSFRDPHRVNRKGEVNRVVLVVVFVGCFFFLAGRRRLGLVEYQQ